MNRVLDEIQFQIYNGSRNRILKVLYSLLVVIHFSRKLVFFFFFLKRIIIIREKERERKNNSYIPIHHCNAIIEKRDR